MTSERVRNRRDPATRVIRAESVKGRRDQRQHARRLGRVLTGDVGPDRDRVDDLARQPASREHAVERPSEKCEIAPGAGAEHVEKARGRRREERSRSHVDPVDGPHERFVTAAAARPAPVDRGGRPGAVGEEFERLTVTRRHAVELVDALQRRNLLEVDSNGIERPCETRAIQQDVGTGVEPRAGKLDAGREASGSRARLEQPNVVPESRQSRGRGEAAHAGADHDDPSLHAGSESRRRISRRYVRASHGSRPSGGNAAVSMAGTNAAPRRLAYW